MGAGPKSESAEHQCEWRDRAEALEGSVASLTEKLEKLTHQIDTLSRRTFGKKSEKLPRISDELRAGWSGPDPVDTLVMQPGPPGLMLHSLPG